MWDRLAGCVCLHQPGRRFSQHARVRAAHAPHTPRPTRVLCLLAWLTPILGQWRGRPETSWCSQRARFTLHAHAPMRTPLCARPYAAVVARAAWGRGASQGSLGTARSKVGSRRAVLCPAGLSATRALARARPATLRGPPALWSTRSAPRHRVWSLATRSVRAPVLRPCPPGCSQLILSPR